MKTDNVVDFPRGALAYREYDVELADGSTILVAFTLSDFGHDTPVARFAHEKNALAFGLVTILDTPQGPWEPMVWMVGTTHLSLAKGASAEPVSDELQVVIELYLRLFFIHMIPIAPHLAAFEWGPAPAANDNRGVL